MIRYAFSVCFSDKSGIPDEHCSWVNPWFGKCAAYFFPGKAGFLISWDYSKFWKFVKDSLTDSSFLKFLVTYRTLRWRQPIACFQSIQPGRFLWQHFPSPSSTKVVSVQPPPIFWIIVTQEEARYFKFEIVWWNHQHFQRFFPCQSRQIALFVHTPRWWADQTEKFWSLVSTTLFDTVI